MYNEFPSHVVSSFRNDWLKGFSFGKTKRTTSQILLLFQFLTCHHKPTRTFSSLKYLF